MKTNTSIKSILLLILLASSIVALHKEKRVLKKTKTKKSTSKTQTKNNPTSVADAEKKVKDFASPQDISFTLNTIKPENRPNASLYKEVCEKAYYHSKPQDFCWRPYLQTPTCTVGEKSGQICYKPCDDSKTGRTNSQGVVLKRDLWGAMCRENCGEYHHYNLQTDLICYANSNCETTNPKPADCHWFGRKLGSATPTASMFSETATCAAPYFKWGPICVASKQIDCPSGSESCGPLACAKDSTTCGKIIAKMVLHTAFAVGELALFATTFGAANAAVMAAKTIVEKITEEVGNKAAFIAAEYATNLIIEAYIPDGSEDPTADGTAYLNRMKAHAKALLTKANVQNVDNALVDTECTTQFKDFVSTAKKMNTAEKIEEFLEKVKEYDPTGITGLASECSSKEKRAADCIRASAEFASKFDITGIIGLAASFIYPLCDTSK